MSRVTCVDCGKRIPLPTSDPFQCPACRTHATLAAERYLIGQIAANVELADDGHQTVQQAIDRIRELLVTSNHFQPTKVPDSSRNISAAAADPASVPSHLRP